MRERLLYLILMLGLVACGEDKAPSETAGGSGGTSSVAKQEPAPTQEVGAEAAALVPADAHAIVCIRSLDGATSMLNDFSQAIGEHLPVDPKMGLAAMTGVDPSLVDGSRQILAAVKMTREAPGRVMTFVLPVTDVDKAAAGGLSLTKVKSGGYLGVSSAQGYAAGEGNALLSDLPDGDIVVRLDLAALAKLYDPEIQGGLGDGQGALSKMLGSQMPGVDAAGMVGKFFGWARDVVASAEQLDLVGGAKGGVVDVDVAFKVKEGSALAKAGEPSGLDALAKYVPSDFPVAILFRFDKSTLKEWMQASMEMAKQNMAPDMRESYGKLMTKSEALLDHLGGDWMASGKVGSDGLRFVTAISAKDPAGYVAEYLELTEDPALADVGMSIKDEGERDVAGVKVRRVRLTIDSAKFGPATGIPAGEVDMFVALLFGTGGINVDLAAAGDKLIMIWGSEDSLAAQVLGASEAPPAMKAARAEARGDLGFLVHVELRSLVQGIAAMARKVGDEKAPEIPDGPAAPVTFYGSREKRVYRFGLHLDAEQVKSIVKLMD